MLREYFLGIIVYLHLPLAFHTATLKPKIDTADPSKQTAKRKATHFRFSRFRAALAVFGRFLVFRVRNSPKCSFIASKISWLKVISIFAAARSQAAQASSGCEMFFRCVIGLPQ
jgi:hypothetical protein